MLTSNCLLTALTACLPTQSKGAVAKGTVTASHARNLDLRCCLTAGSSRCRRRCPVCAGRLIRFVGCRSHFFLFLFLFSFFLSSFSPFFLPSPSLSLFLSGCSGCPRQA